MELDRDPRRRGPYNDRARRLSEVLAIEPAHGGNSRDAGVTYHVINVNYAWERYALTASCDRLAPRPTAAELAGGERVTPGHYGRAGQARLLRACARVIATAPHQRRAFRLQERGAVFTTEELAFCWIFEDGSRIALAQPRMYCMVDPLRDGPHCLDFSQPHFPETTGPLVFADYKRLPHLVPQEKYTPDPLPELLPCTHFIRQSVLFNPPAPSRRR